MGWGKSKNPGYLTILTKSEINYGIKGTPANIEQLGLHRVNTMKMVSIQNTNDLIIYK